MLAVSYNIPTLRVEEANLNLRLPSKRHPMCGGKRSSQVGLIFELDFLAEIFTGIHSRVMP